MPEHTLIPISDIAPPDSSPEPATSRPVIPSEAASPDPMIATKTTGAVSSPPRRVEPLKNDPKHDGQDGDGDGIVSPPKPAPSVEANLEPKADAPALTDAERQQLLDDKTYVLPIVTQENRQSRHVLIAGSCLIVLLGLAWLDIALDAGFVTINGLQPLTKFFGAILV